MEPLDEEAIKKKMEEINEMFDVSGRIYHQRRCQFYSLSFKCLLNVGIQQLIRIFISDTEDLTDTEGTLDDESNSIFRYAFFIGVIILS